jgi:hypothetical protein
MNSRHYTKLDTNKMYMTESSSSKILLKERKYPGNCRTNLFLQAITLVSYPSEQPIRNILKYFLLHSISKVCF